MLVRLTTSIVIFLVLGSPFLSPLFGDFAKKRTTFEFVEKQAFDLSRKPYKAPKSRLPDEFLDLDYDGYRKIIWNPQQSLWREDNLNFRLEFFHPGYLFREPVVMNEFSESHVQNVPFTSEFFEYGDLDLNPRRISRRAHYAGFRLLFPLNDGDKFDEMLSFLGASYFRALGQGQRYGKSARALAINTGLDQPEEFPIFKEFWIGKPEFESVETRVFGLLDSESVSGAYQFDIRPGKETFIDVKAVLFFRKQVEWLGIAPLTSMYWYGENGGQALNDCRPEVHDSDGLLVESESGRTWRVLANDGRKRTYTHSGEGITGFGLMQRDRDFDHYQDLEAWYQARPSVWIEPKSSFGEGSVQVIEFPTNHEFFDNVVSARVPAKMPNSEEPFTVEYRLRWTNGLEASDVARVISTRFGKPVEGKAGIQFVFEFDRPGEQASWSADAMTVNFDGLGPAAISDIKIFENPLNNRWRVVFLVQGTEPADLACRLLHNGDLVSEMWSYPWKPN